jgi:hypothetical protein
LTEEERFLIQNSKDKLKTNKFNSDSLLHILSKYLEGNQYLTFYQANELGQLIDKIPTEDAFTFLLNNIDIRLDKGGLGGISRDWRNYPFYVILINSTSKDKRTLDYIFSEVDINSLVGNCDINGKKMIFLRAYFLEIADFNEAAVEDCLKTALRKASEDCSITNINYMLSKKFPNDRYSTKVR